MSFVKRIKGYIRNAIRQAGSSALMVAWFPDLGGVKIKLVSDRIFVVSQRNIVNSDQEM